MEASGSDLNDNAHMVRNYRNYNCHTILQRTYVCMSSNLTVCTDSYNCVHILPCCARHNYYWFGW